MEIPEDVKKEIEELDRKVLKIVEGIFPTEKLLKRIFKDYEWSMVKSALLRLQRSKDLITMKEIDGEIVWMPKSRRRRRAVEA